MSNDTIAAPDPLRRRLIKAVHARGRALGIDAETRRAMQIRITGHASCREMNAADLRGVLAEMDRSRPATEGPRAARGQAGRAGDRLPDTAHRGKLRALWISGWHLGVVHDRTDAGLAAFITSPMELGAAKWAREDRYTVKAVEALKAWLAREAGVDWRPYVRVRRDGGVDEIDNPRARVLEAQWRILAGLGAVRIADPGALSNYAARHAGIARTISHTQLDAERADALIRHLGGRIRRAKAERARDRMRYLEHGTPGCTNCYAMRLAGGRLRNHPSRTGLTDLSKAGPVWNGAVRFNVKQLDQPLRWRKPRMIFVCAHGDLFHEAVYDEWIDRVFAVMALCPRHTFQVLTKRPQRMRDYLAVMEHEDQLERWCDAAVAISGDHNAEDRVYDIDWPLPNVWLGVIEDRERADERIPPLLETPAAVRFVSCEPLLGPIDLQMIGGYPCEQRARLGPAVTWPTTASSICQIAVAGRRERSRCARHGPCMGAVPARSEPRRRRLVPRRPENRGMAGCRSVIGEAPKPALPVLN